MRENCNRVQIPSLSSYRLFHGFGTPKTNNVYFQSQYTQEIFRNCNYRGTEKLPGFRILQDKYQCTTGAPGSGGNPDKVADVDLDLDDLYEDGVVVYNLDDVDDFDDIYDLDREGLVHLIDWSPLFSK